MKPYGFKHRDMTVGNDDSVKIKNIRKKKARSSDKAIIDAEIEKYLNLNMILDDDNDEMADEEFESQFENEATPEDLKKYLVK